jgi:type IV pilus assembly protein PilC
LGKIFRRRAFNEFLRGLSVLTLSHVSLQSALRLVGAETAPALKPMIRKIQQGVARGEPFSVMVSGLQLVDEWVLALLHLGEESGKLNRMLQRISQRLDSEERKFFQSIFTLAEPTLVALTGVGVGLFIYLVVGPLFDLLTKMTW